MTWNWQTDTALFPTYSGSLASLSASLPINLANYCTGNGVAEDAAGFQAALDALPAEGGRLTSPPGKKYRISTGLTMSGKADVQIDLNGSYIESRVASGAVMTFKGAHRARILSPRFRLMSGAPSAFMSFPSGGVAADYSWWVTVYEPVIWSNIDIPANCDGIVVDDDNYWVEIIRPQIRKLSGTLTGTFRRGITFQSQANACLVWGGSINNCDDGVLIESCNACAVDGTAFEGITNSAVKLQDTDTPLGGTLIQNLRVEACPITVDMSGATRRTTTWSSIKIGHIKNQASPSRNIYNPNNFPITRVDGEQIHLATSWGADRPRLSIWASDNTGSDSLIATKKRDISCAWARLSADITAVQTTIDVVSTAAGVGTFPAAGALRIRGLTAAGARTYELVSYTSFTATQFLGCVRGLNGTTAAAHTADDTLVEDSRNETFQVDGNGTIIARNNASSPPTPADERFMIHHGPGSFTTKLIAWDPASAGSHIQQVVGNGAGGFTVVTDAFAASFRPGTTATQDLGIDATRWRRLFLSEQIIESYQTIATDAIFTLQPSSLSPQNTRHTGVLTADRQVTLSTAGAAAGMKYRITRTGGGAFNLLIGTGPLKALATNTWCEVTYDGTAWYLSQYGAL